MPRETPRARTQFGNLGRTEREQMESLLRRYQSTDNEIGRGPSARSYSKVEAETALNYYNWKKNKGGTKGKGTSYTLDSLNERMKKEYGSLGDVTFVDAQKAEGMLSYLNQRADNSKLQEAAWKDLSKKTASSMATQNASRKAATDKAMEEGHLNGLPVKLDDRGMLRYDIEKIGEHMGLSPEEVQKYSSVKFGTGKAADALQRLESRAGVRGWDQEANQQYREALKSVGGKGEGAIIQNLAYANPLEAKVDLSKEDMLINLAKPGFLERAPKMDQKDRLNSGQGPSGIGKYASIAVPAVVGVLGSMVGGPLVGAAMTTFMNAAKKGDFDLKDMATDYVKSAGMGLASSAIGGALKGAITAGKAGTSIGEGLISGVTDTNYLGALGSDFTPTGGQTGLEVNQGTTSGQFAPDMDVRINPMESAVDVDMFSGVTEQDFGQMPGVVPPTGGEGSMLEGGLQPFNNTGIGFEDADFSYGRPSGAALREGAENQAMFTEFGSGGVYDPRVGGMGFEDVDWSYGRPGPQALAEMGQLAQDAGQIFDSTSSYMVNSGGSQYYDVGMDDAMNLITTLGPIGAAAFLDGRQKKKTVPGEAATGLTGLQDLYSTSGQEDPYSEQQMFSAGIQ